MAATDKPYRNQRILDIVFAASCGAMLLSVVWMFADDYYREYKPYQRRFRDVETALNERQMIQELPHPEIVQAKEEALKKAREDLDSKKKELAPLENKLLAQRDNAAARFQGIKALLDSRASYYDIAVEHRGECKPGTAEFERAEREVKERAEEVEGYRKQLAEALKAIDDNKEELRQKVRKELEPYENRLAALEDDLKRTTAAFDRFGKSTAQKAWTVYDSIRTLPVIDAFASPTRINQISLNDLTIEYGTFKEVPRYDRCTSCHLGIDRAMFSPDSLEALADEPYDAKLRLRWARKLFQDRKKGGEKLGFDLGNLPRSVSTMSLSKGEVRMYAAHPRLDLFVDANSPHPMEKIGCTICHAGQGSATSFTLAAHTPADHHQEEEWRREHGWSPSHFWDYPMYSSRFVESSCLKCHHQVTDLIRHGSKEEAPKLLHGYFLVQEMGCFGCHEIAGLKSGRPVGPDLRLEPSPALAWLSPMDQEKAKSDPANPPGLYRKVGPSLRRLAEKTNEEWTRKWINSPRGFREDTRMPHFYNLSNNIVKDPVTGEAILPESQKNFPGTEIHCLAAYLFEESRRNLSQDQWDSARTFLWQRYNELLDQLKQQAREKDPATGAETDRRLFGPLSDKDKKDLDSITRQLTDLALLSVPSQAARINTVTAELKQVQDMLQELLQEPEARRRQLLQDRQVAELKKDKDRVKNLDEQLKEGQSAFEQIVGLSQKSLDSLGALAEKENEPAKKKKLVDDLALQTRNSKDRRLRLEKLVEDLKELSRPTPIAREVRSWDGSVVLKDKQEPPAGNKEKGRKLFIEKGCLACHSHDGASWEVKGQESKSVVTGDAIFGPNLSRMAAKLGSSKDPQAGHRWLLQWILNPNIHHPRTRMPITQLSKEDAADIAAWILSQKVVDWQGDDPAPSPSIKDLKALAKVYLIKAPGMTVEDVNNFLGVDDDKAPPGIPKDRLRGLARDAEEQRLLERKGGVDEASLKWYIGKKSINRLGCFGCHDTPGFEMAKNIGTALNDWGKKDADRLAFEDSGEFVDLHFNIVNARDNAEEPTRPDPDWKGKDGKAPMERIFAEALKHHSRIGFLNLKLTEPRSYDYLRQRTWDDRLRMPQFRFARNLKRQKDEVLEPLPEKASESQKKAIQAENKRREARYQARTTKEEAEAREAVMTFILGLVAEPIPLKHMAQPNADKLAEIKGRQVLERFNCGGCHQVRPGVFEFRPSSDVLKDLDGRLNDPGMIKTILENHSFLGHNAWMGTPSPYPDRMLAMATHLTAQPKFDPDPEEGRPEFLVIRLTDALRFTNDNRVVRDFPAGGIIRIPLKDLPPELQPPPQVFQDPAQMPARINAWAKRVLPQAFGGTFRDLLTGYTKEEYKDVAKGDDDARNLLPPPLIREGERVQPNWLYQFLLKPYAIRPQVLLRMPQFNMSSDEAMALVNYFTAVERLTNASAGLAGAFLHVDQHDAGYWHRKNEEYVKKLSDAQKKKRLDELKPIWALVQEDQMTALKPEQALAEKELANAKEEDKKASNDATKNAIKEAQEKVDRLKKKLDDLKASIDKKDYKALEKEWLTKDAYAADAYRLLLSHKGRICLSCHSIGEQGLVGAKAPPLDKVSERLRPDWTMRWIAFPMRMFAYNTTMPANFPREETGPKEKIFADEDTLEQIKAVRDVLLNYPRISSMPVNRYFRPAPAGGKP